MTLFACKFSLKTPIFGTFCPLWTFHHNWLLSPNGRLIPNRGLVSIGPVINIGTLVLIGHLGPKKSLVPIWSLVPIGLLAQIELALCEDYLYNHVLYGDNNQHMIIVVFHRHWFIHIWSIPTKKEHRAGIARNLISFQWTLKFSNVWYIHIDIDNTNPWVPTFPYLNLFLDCPVVKMCVFKRFYDTFR